MTKFEEEFNYLIELSGKVLIGQVGAEVFEKNRVSFFEKYETGQRIMQAVFVKYGLVDNDNANGERTGGFGSTGEV